MLLYLLATIGFVDAFLLFTAGANQWPHWFNPFMGMLIIAALPFFGAMVAMPLMSTPSFPDREKTDDIS